MIEKIACKLGQNDEAPNIELAELLCKTEDTAGIKEIANGIKDNDKAVSSDCIKVLYEIGARKPALISAYASDFLALLYSRNNRLVWGSMTALGTIADLVPEVIYKEIDRVLSAFNSGSVITIDNGITVLAKLCKADKKYESHLFPLLLEHLKTCCPKDICRLSERMSLCVSKDNVKEFFDILNHRKNHLDGKQIERIIKLENKITKQLK